ncbi:MAG TPA: group I intron-associated PD-(D/E)XK endonuclease [Candidatus Limnocylindria bacterium]|nr:group I intron-associated PD-(D/E)XK endonuclease [Candidatus Limnocylindria bacterium]
MSQNVLTCIEHLCEHTVVVAAHFALRDTTSLGDITEAQVAAALVRRGMRILRPISSATRYDLLIDHNDGRFTRVQCKTGNLRHGCVVFRLYSISGHDTQRKQYAGQADAFGVYCPQTNRSYLVPMTAISACRSFATLRVEPTKSGQRRGTRNADEFAIS